MLFLFGLCTFMNALAWISMTPMTTILIGAYGMSWSGVHFIANIYLGAFIPFSFPSSYLIDIKGIRFSLNVCIILSAIGIGMKCLIGYGNYWVYFGQTLLAIAQPIVFNMPCAISAVWFPEGERALSTSIGANANLFGVAIGFFVPAWFVQGDIKDYKRLHPDTWKHEAQRDIFWCLVF